MSGTGLRALVDATMKLGRLREHCSDARTRYATWDPASRTHREWARYARDVRETLK